MAGEMNIRTTITADSVQRIFGPPASIDYRSHPAGGETLLPSTVFQGMKEKEIAPFDNIKKLKGTVYSYKNRKIITCWLRDVCAAFDLKSTTLCLSIQLTDAFITNSLQSIPLSKCQLAAITCLWVAAKFEEMDGDLPKLRKIVHICDKAYTAQEILDMEETVLTFFKWRLPHTTVINHLYLQLHMLTSKDLVKTGDETRVKEKNGLISLKLLIMKDFNWEWKSMEVDVETKLSDTLPMFCTMLGIPVSHNIQMFQLFGENLLVARCVPLDVIVGSLPLDSQDETRLYLSNGSLNLVFVEHDSFTLLRTINQRFLDLAELLIQEAVTHVEFLQVHSHVTALGVLTLAMCIMANNLEECKRSILYIQKTLGIPAPQAFAAARLLCTKCQEAKEASSSHGIHEDIPENIFERLEGCLVGNTV
ncbi:cyclin [Trypanosoma theileri]|uniref:Cyclin n=1 Tax=Trypanosoma theileri TaxID=67003 RepID=A0A1X0P2F8_9TRYP|nr:cyclin [Trypanosoma theileri]ORC91085.1 cyclin [Trypanosoma theileri]